MTGKIIGVGLSKTGTTSLYAALARLGYRSGTFRHQQRLGLERWLQGDFETDYLADYDAITDLPISCFYRELDERYPGSRFILTERDMDGWLASIHRQFSQNDQPGPFALAARFMAYGYSVFNEGAFRRRHEAHVSAVRDYFADRPDSLLVMNVFRGDGWPELCGFLGHPVPDEPYPNVKPRFMVNPARG